MVTNQDLNFNFMETSITYQERELRLMKAKVRVKGILNSILENIRLNQVPKPLLSFLDGLIKDKQFIPDNFATTYELERVNLDQYGAFTKLDHNQRRMFFGIYLIIKILVAKVLLNPRGSGMFPQNL